MVVQTWLYYTLLELQFAFSKYDERKCDETSGAVGVLLDIFYYYARLYLMYMLPELSIMEDFSYAIDLECIGTPAEKYPGLKTDVSDNYDDLPYLLFYLITHFELFSKLPITIGQTAYYNRLKWMMEIKGYQNPLLGAVPQMLSKTEKYYYGDITCKFTRKPDVLDRSNLQYPKDCIAGFGHAECNAIRHAVAFWLNRDGESRTKFPGIMSPRFVYDVVTPEAAVKNGTTAEKAMLKYLKGPKTLHEYYMFEYIYYEYARSRYTTGLRTLDIYEAKRKMFTEYMTKREKKKNASSDVSLLVLEGSALDV